MRLSSVILVLTQLACAGLNTDKLKSAGTFSARIILTDPLNSKCRESALKDCEDVTEGMFLYVEGQQDKAKPHLRTAAQANTPESIAVYVRAIHAIGDIPGTAEYMGPLLDAARFLTPESSGSFVVTSEGSSSGTSSSPASAVPKPALAAFGPLPADLDPTLLDGGIATPGISELQMKCAAAGTVGRCILVATGPLVVTDLHHAGSCKQPLLVLIADPNGDLGSPRWAVTGVGAAIAMHGARVVVRPSEALLIGVAGTGHDARCAVAWNGFRSIPVAPENGAPMLVAERSVDPSAVATTVTATPTAAPEHEATGQALASDREASATVSKEKTVGELYMEASLLMGSDKFREAIEKYHAVIDLRPTGDWLGSAYRRLGKAHALLGENERAIEYLRLYATLAPPEEQDEVANTIAKLRNADSVRGASESARAAVRSSFKTRVSPRPSPAPDRSVVKPDARSCAPFLPAVVPASTDIYARPDGSSQIIMSLKLATPLCISSSPEGLGFSRVKLLDGKSGFVRIADLEN